MYRVSSESASLAAVGVADLLMLGRRGVKLLVRNLTLSLQTDHKRFLHEIVVDESNNLYICWGISYHLF